MNHEQGSQFFFRYDPTSSYSGLKEGDTMYMTYNTSMPQCYIIHDPVCIYNSSCMSSTPLNDNAFFF